MAETLAHGYSSESTQGGLFNEYQHDRVYMVFKDFCVLELQMEVASALEGLNDIVLSSSSGEGKTTPYKT